MAKPASPRASARGSQGSPASAAPVKSAPQGSPSTTKQPNKTANDTKPVVKSNGTAKSNAGLKPAVPAPKAMPTAGKSVAPAGKPGASAVKPGAAAVKSGAAVVKPGAAAVKSAAPGVKPAATAARPTAPVAKPNGVAAKVTAPGKVSSKPVAKPVAAPVAPAKPASVVETKPSADRPVERLKPSDITSMASALRFLAERPDFERMRSVRYDETTFQLGRMRKLLELLGNPHQQVKTVHVAGTNGKGSTVSMIASMLRNCGYAVGVYTSPHLVDIRERVQIDGQSIGKADFIETLREVAEAGAKLPEEPTFFELLTAVGFKHFAEQAVDIAVIEVGLGGRLDSTNVIVPLVSVVTGIDLDHTKLLGGTRQAIAREKAGIFKKGVPALFFEQDPAVDAVMREMATELGADLRIVNKDIEFSSRFCVTPEEGPHTRVCMYTKTSRLEHLPVPLPGEHQAVNCGLALAAVDILKGYGFELPEDKLTAGLAATRVPGRMELVNDRPRILCDGAHNPAAMNALMRCVGAHVPYDSMVCVFGCCADKDIGEMLDKVNLGADKVIFTRATGTPRAAAPDDLQKLFQERSGKMSQIARTVPEAIEMAIRAVSREDLICVTGSFYVVGEAIKHLQERR